MAITISAIYENGGFSVFDLPFLWWFDEASRLHEGELGPGEDRFEASTTEEDESVVSLETERDEDGEIGGEIIGWWCWLVLVLVDTVDDRELPERGADLLNWWFDDDVPLTRTPWSGCNVMLG